MKSIIKPLLLALTLCYSLVSLSFTIKDNPDPLQFHYYGDGNNGNVVSTYGSHAVYLSNPHDVAVCISGHNKIPYILKEDIYIQNENISEPATYDGDNIMIGSNVTNTKLPDR